MWLRDILLPSVPVAEQIKQGLIQFLKIQILSLVLLRQLVVDPEDQVMEGLEEEDFAQELAVLEQQGKEIMAELAAALLMAAAVAAAHLLSVLMVGRLLAVLVVPELPVVLADHQLHTQAVVVAVTKAHLLGILVVQVAVGTVETRALVLLEPQILAAVVVVVAQ